MGNDEYERLIEYSEMTSFNFKSKEYWEVRKDFLECKKNANRFLEFFENLKARFFLQAAE